MAFKLGDQATDSITGFSGTITAMAQYIHASPRAEITANALINGEVKSLWIEEARLVPSFPERSADLYTA